MAGNHIALVHEALSAIDKLNSDVSVDSDTTKESLEELKEHIEMLLDALDS